MAAYVIYQGDVLDPERYEEYKVKAAESIVAAGGTYLVRGGNVEVLEGEAPGGRTVLLEFKTMQAALDWYRSAKYTEIRNIREGAARARMYVVEAVTLTPLHYRSAARRARRSALPADRAGCSGSGNACERWVNVSLRTLGGPMRRKLCAGVLTTGVTLGLMASPAFGGPPANHDHYLTVSGTGAQIQVAPPICELEGTPAEEGAHGAFHNFHSNVHTGTPATQGDLTITPAFC